MQLQFPPRPAAAAFILRVALGTVMIAHSLLKVLVFGLPGTAAFFAAHGFPGWTAYPVFALELIGGLLLLAGRWVQLVAATLLPVLAGAFLVHFPNGWNFAAPHGGWEYIAFLMAALVVQALLGPGSLRNDANTRQ